MSGLVAVVAPVVAMGQPDTHRDRHCGSGISGNDLVGVVEIAAAPGSTVDAENS